MRSKRVQSLAGVCFETLLGPVLLENPCGEADILAIRHCAGQRSFSNG